ncbi:MAG: helix-turn-helix domain-containing protein [Verrucomicrobiota bacterium]
MPGQPNLFHVRVSLAPRIGEHLLGVGEIAQRLGVSVRSARRLMASGAIRSHCPGLRRRRVYQRDLDAYCRERGVAG